MYAAYFGLKDNPFRMTPDPRYLFVSPSHREALEHLHYGISERKGFVMITGGVGTGKTTLLRALLGDLDPLVRSALIFNPFVSGEDLLHTVCDEFGITVGEHATNKDCMDAFNAFCIDVFRGGGNVVLLLDEAQNLGREVLEQIRMLSNLETEKEKLLQIVFVGQTELVDLLTRGDMRQLNDRITVRHHLGPLGSKDVRAYVHHRMVVAGCRGKVPFTWGALRALHGVTRGNPRRINAVCDRALLAAYSAETRRVTAAVLRKAAREVRAGDARPSTGGASQRKGLAAAVLVLCLCLGWYLGWRLQPELPRAIGYLMGPGREAPESTDGSARSHPERVVSRRISPPASSGPSASSPSLPKQGPEPASVPSAQAHTETPSREDPESMAPLWLLGEEQSLALLLRAHGEAYASRGAGKPELFSFNAGMETARLFTRPFRVTVRGPDGSEAYAVVARRWQSGFLLVDRAGSPVFLSDEEMAVVWQGSVLWAVPREWGLLKVHPGTRGDVVRRVQQALREVGFAVEPDGIYGPKTYEAVKGFQERCNIPVDGSVGFPTLSLLFQFSRQGGPL